MKKLNLLSIEVAVREGLLTFCSIIGTLEHAFTYLLNETGFWDPLIVLDGIQQNRT